jgi:MOSC domain-containing protein YiiM
VERSIKRRERVIARIIAVCRSDEKGTKKEPIDEDVLKEGFGLPGDAHTDFASHRQISLLVVKSIEKMRALGLDLGPGDFAENLTTERIDLVSLAPGTRITIGDEVVLEVSQNEKECHTPAVRSSNRSVSASCPGRGYLPGLSAADW